MEIKTYVTVPGKRRPCRAFFQNRVIGTVAKRALSYKMHYIFSDESKVLLSYSR